MDDLVALQLSSERPNMFNRCLVHIKTAAQRWFKFHNVGPIPHRTSDHAMASDGTWVFVLGGYPQADGISLIHVFDTSMSFRSVVHPDSPQD